MPVHDWTRVGAGIFHDFHQRWIGAIRDALNGGLLPNDFYALAEQAALKTHSRCRAPRRCICLSHVII